MRAWLRGKRVLRRASEPVLRGLALAVMFALGVRVGAETQAAEVRMISPAFLEAVTPMTGAVAEAGAAPASVTVSVPSSPQPVPASQPNNTAVGRSRAGEPCEPGELLRAGHPVDLNQATADQLEALPGIGPVLARRIVDFRTRFGPFRQVDDLVEVTGVGPKTLERVRDRVTVRADP